MKRAKYRGGNGRKESSKHTPQRLPSQEANVSGLISSFFCFSPTCLKRTGCSLSQKRLVLFEEIIPTGNQHWMCPYDKLQVAQILYAYQVQSFYLKSSLYLCPLIDPDSNSKPLLGCSLFHLSPPNSNHSFTLPVV